MGDGMNNLLEVKKEIAFLKKVLKKAKSEHNKKQKALKQEYLESSQKIRADYANKINGRIGKCVLGYGFDDMEKLNELTKEIANQTANLFCHHINVVGDRFYLYAPQKPLCINFNAIKQVAIKVSNRFKGATWENASTNFSSAFVLKVIFNSNNGINFWSSGNDVRISDMKGLAVGLERYDMEDLLWNLSLDAYFMKLVKKEIEDK